MPRRAIIFRILWRTSYQVTIGNMGSIGAVEHKEVPAPALESTIWMFQADPVQEAYRR